jgi:hypothetical protein
MNDYKLGKLFAAARRENPPMLTEGFEFIVMQAIKRETAPRAVTVFDQMNMFFPRLAWAAVVTIALCIAGDWLTGGAQMNLTDGVTQLSQHWLLTGNGF